MEASDISGRATSEPGNDLPQEYALTCVRLVGIDYPIGKFVEPKVCQTLALNLKLDHRVSQRCFGTGRAGDSFCLNRINMQSYS